VQRALNMHLFIIKIQFYSLFENNGEKDQLNVNQLNSKIKHFDCGFCLAKPLQEYYIIAPGHIYQAPDAASVITHRLVR